MRLTRTSQYLLSVCPSIPLRVMCYGTGRSSSLTLSYLKCPHPNDVNIPPFLHAVSRNVAMYYTTANLLTICLYPHFYWRQRFLACVLNKTKSEKNVIKMQETWLYTIIFTWPPKMFSLPVMAYWMTHQLHCSCLWQWPNFNSRLHSSKALLPWMLTLASMVTPPLRT